MLRRTTLGVLEVAAGVRYPFPADLAARVNHAYFGAFRVDHPRPAQDRSKRSSHGRAQEPRHHETPI